MTKDVTYGREDGSNVAHQLLNPDNTIEIAEPGYMYIWISNENETPVEVYFDDFKVTQTKSPVVQTDDYYPFGMSMSSYQRENSLLNKFLYNGGSEKQTDIDANIYSMFFRGMDVSIGRMMQVDPMADKYSSLSPYNFAFNDPVFWNDVSGADPEWETGRYYGTLGAFEHILPNTSTDDFIRTSLNSRYGGMWGGGGSFLFTSNEQAFEYGVAYNDYHDSWSNTEYGSERASRIAFDWINSSGVVPDQQMIAYLDQSVNPALYSMNACLTCNPLKQDTWPTTTELKERFGESFKKDFADPIVSKYSGTRFDPDKLRQEIEDFDYNQIKDSKNQYYLTPVFGRLAVGNETHPFYYDQKLFNVPEVYMLPLRYQVINPGTSMISFQNAQGDLVSFTVRLQLVIPN